MKIAIMTTFQEFQPGYSLTGIVKDQVEMLARYEHEVHLFVNERYHGEDFPGNVQLRKEIPFTHLKDYQSVREMSDEHKVIREETANRMVKILGEEEFDVVFTHDFVFMFPDVNGLGNDEGGVLTSVYEISYSSSITFMDFADTGTMSSQGQFASVAQVNDIGATDGPSGWSAATTWTVVPEPVSSTLFLAGAASLGVRRFLRKREV